MACWQISPATFFIWHTARHETEDISSPTTNNGDLPVLTAEQQMAITNLQLRQLNEDCRVAGL